MTTYEIVRLVVYLIGVPIIGYLLWNASRKLRDIRALDAKLKAEAEQNRRNPYAQMAEILEANELIKGTRREQ